MSKLLSGIAAVSLILVGSVPSSAQSVDWERYVDPQYGFSAELPYGVFEPLEDDGSGGLTLGEVGGTGQISIYGGDAGGLTLEGFAERLSAGEEVRSITYQAGGDSWFVLSGYYQPDAEGERLIFYTKVLLSPDRETFSAFEISYDLDEKARFDGIVSRIEDSFTRPPAG
ncbi:hypothetical protein [Devosia naphthalenivorans]|uniref:hypothetical protein n=1 Tax=Devosia naphthalenivorans TaxID=2082392 RepID=UPI000D3DA63C|nr:hypothetical protein [Devosia naphthalenivorans]